MGLTGRISSIGSNNIELNGVINNNAKYVLYPAEYLTDASVNDNTLNITKYTGTVVTFTKPEKTSDLVNDSGFITEHQSLTNYYTKPEVNTITDGISQNLSSHVLSTSNPHSVTKAQVGLSNVEDKSSDTIRSELTSSNVTTALGYTPVQPNDLSVYSLITETGNQIELSLNSANYKMTATLKDKNGNIIDTSNEIDLPLEEMIVNVSFDSSTNELVFTLKSGTVTRVPIGTIIGGLATQTWVQNNYSTTSVINTALNNKQDKSTAVTHTASTAVGSTNKPVYIDSTGASTVINYEINKTVPSDAKFTDTVTTVSISGNGNAITNISAIDGALTATKETTFLTAHQDISGKENTSNKITTITSSSTDTQYPSAKAVYDLIIGAMEASY